MQIIIPMSGFGERFRKAGYAVPKPLIEIDGKPIIAYVIDMFPDETDFIFICNQQHLDEPSYHMQEILERYCTTGNIIGIPPHRLGPIHAVLQIKDQIDRNKPTIVNYCDFTCDWDWLDFKRHVIATKCDGSVPAYKGFHPHTLGSTNYAYMRTVDGWMQDIQEKKPYTDNRMEEYASSGTYYFASGKMVVDVFEETVRQGLGLNGEYYVSLAYKVLLSQGKKVSVYPLKHFMQWGTPEDVQEYLGWSQAFRTMIQGTSGIPVKQGSVIVPMAGLGMRFAKEGYVLPKPLIQVSGKSMVVQAADDLPLAKFYSFVLRSDMTGSDAIQEEIKVNFPGVVLKLVPDVTEGQAITSLIGLDALEGSLGHELEGPITFGACDNGALYDRAKFNALIESGDTDVIVWAARGHANAVRNPHMFGWIAHEGDLITGVSVKVPLSDPANDPIVIGTFTFKSAEIFRRCVSHMIARNARVNNEFYLDTTINDALEMGLRCKIFIVDSFLSWGTPNDLKTFEYWQDCFDGWPFHSYRKKNDPRFVEGMST